MQNKIKEDDDIITFDDANSDVGISKTETIEVAKEPELADGAESPLPSEGNAEQLDSDARQRPRVNKQRAGKQRGRRPINRRGGSPRKVQKMVNKIFKRSLPEEDKEVATAIYGELKRQQDGIELIASENITSLAVIQAQGSVLTNKYAEGYPGKRYYGGCEYADTIENLAINRAKELFYCQYANVQPNSGSQANQAVFQALLNTGDTILGLSLAAGGHLTHGAAPNQSGKWFNAVQYGVKKEDGLIDYEEIATLAKEHQPKLIIGGFSAYPRIVDWAKLREIADEVGAYLLVDMAHIAGLVAGGSYPSPIAFADVVTTTTHKTLRGPRGGLILSNFPEKTVAKTKKGSDISLARKIDSAVFPGIQGGPLVHVIASKAVCFKQASDNAFKKYARDVVTNARVLCEILLEKGYDIVTGGTDNHICLLDLRPKNITGDIAELALERAGLTANKNAVPFDPEKPTVTSGIRLGAAAATSRGFGKEEFKLVAEFIAEVLDIVAQSRVVLKKCEESEKSTPEEKERIIQESEKMVAEVESSVKKKVVALCRKFPIY